MRRKNVTNAIIRESITEALLILMKQKPFAQINITEIVQKAGVGRVTFYRNYSSKEDVLVSTLNEAATQWWTAFRTEARSDYVEALFAHCMTVRAIVLLLYEQDLMHLLFRNVNDLLGPAAGDSELLAYQKSCLSGCVFGVLNEWFGRGMTDSPEKMSRLLRNIQIDGLVQSVIEQETQKTDTQETASPAAH